MILLALETSTMLGGVAIMKDNTLIAESRANVKITHSERVLGEIDHVLKRSGLTLDDIDVFGISIGPGSFTGLRVGLSTIKGLVYATGKKLVTVTTLEALAWNVPFSAYNVCPLLDARKKQVYAAVFKWSGNGFVRVLDEQAIAIADLLSLIDGPAVFLGDAMSLYRDIISEKMGANAFFAPPQKAVPFPSNVAYLCMDKALKGEFDDTVGLSPLYLRKSEAEVKLTADKRL